MKQKVYFEGTSGYDHYANIMHLADDETADYEVVLRDTDKLFESDFWNLILERDGIQYTQTTEMSGFKGVNFTPYGLDVDHLPDVQLKLIKLPFKGIEPK